MGEEFQRVAPASEIDEGEILEFELPGGSKVCLARLEGEIYAFSHTCTHAAFALEAGDLDPDDCAVECSLHGARFDIKSGEVLEGPATEDLPIYPVEVREGEVFVSVPGTET